MGKQKKAMHDAAGRKIIHPADAQRKRAKKQWREMKAQRRKKHYEGTLLQKAPEVIEAEIAGYKEMEAAGKLTKAKKDRMTREVTAYSRLKDQVKEKNQKKLEAQNADYLHVDFEELKVHRKASIFYDPVNNPYGAPPAGQSLMYCHPDGSVKREPPPLPDSEAVGADARKAGPKTGIAEGESSTSCSSEEEEGGGGGPEDTDDDDEEPMLPETLPDSTLLAPGALAALPPGFPPSFPPGFPPTVSPGPGLPPLPAGPPPGASPRSGMPPLPPGLPSGVLPGPGLPPFLAGDSPGMSAGPGLPPLPPGPPPGMSPNPGLPPLPLGQSPGASQVPGPPLLAGPPAPTGPFAPSSAPSIPPWSSSSAPLGLSGLQPTPVQQPLPPNMNPLLKVPGALPNAQLMSQADFAAELRQRGYDVSGPGLPGLPPGFGPMLPPEASGQPGPWYQSGSFVPWEAPSKGQHLAPDRPPPGALPKAKAKLAVESVPMDVGKVPSESGRVKAATPVQSMADLPVGTKAPPPPPKKAAAAGQQSRVAPPAATVFMPTTLRSKKPSQVAGGVLQVSSASLSQEARKRVLATERPVVKEKVDLEEAFTELMQELG